MAKLSPEEKRIALQKMSELLRAGAIMLSETCPKCGSPLFKLKSGEIVCPIHGRVVVVKSDEELSRVTVAGVLDALENTITKQLEKVRSIVEKREPSELVDELRVMLMFLDALERVERIKGILGKHDLEKQ